MKKNNIKKGKVLFLYPNSEGYWGVPNGLALLSGCLKEAGFETKCFDTTFLKSPPLSHMHRQKYWGILKVEHNKMLEKWNPELEKKTPELFLKTIEEFKPDLIAVYIVDVFYKYAISLLKEIKNKFDIPVVAGGTTITMCPEIVINNDCIDIICIGEGEDAMVELANCIVNHKDHSNIMNLWTKKDKKIIKNQLRPLKDMDTLPFQDWSIFDERHYYKAYCGKFRRTGFFELARGCHFNCSYCCTGNLRKLYGRLGKFVRTRNIDKAFDEICYMNDKYKLELIFFNDDNFLGMPPERFKYFCEQYKKRINLPFYIQTRSETIKEDYIKKLKEINLSTIGEINISTIGIGIEHGNEEFRKTYLNRHMNNKSLQKAFRIAHKYGIRTTANIIMGFPYENEELCKETIKLVKNLKPKSYSLNYFQPYSGTKMREEAVKLGYIQKDHIINESNKCLNMPQFKKERLMHYYENFKKYLDSELKLE